MNRWTLSPVGGQALKMGSPDAYPYGTLLTLYLLVIGGGGAWLYFQVREVERSLVVDEVLMEIEPLAEKLRQVDAMAFVR